MCLTKTCKQLDNSMPSALGISHHFNGSKPAMLPDRLSLLIIYKKCLEEPWIVN